MDPKKVSEALLVFEDMLKEVCHVVLIIFTNEKLDRKMKKKMNEN